MNVEKKWMINVSEAKRLLALKTHNQIKVARLAVEVCEITWGGNQADYDDRFTLKRFALKIGVKAKTLSNWVAIYLNVYRKCSKELRQKASYSQLSYIGRQVNHETTKAEVNKLVDRVVNLNSLDHLCLKYTTQIKSLIYNLKEKSGVLRLSDNILEEILWYATIVVKIINKENPRIKPKNNNMVHSAAAGLTSSAAEGLYGKVKIFRKDITILKFLKRHKMFYSPTYIGNKIGFNYKSNTANKLWALRALYKLESCGLVEKNNRGWFKYKKDLIKTKDINLFR